AVGGGEAGSQETDLARLCSTSSAPRGEEQRCAAPSSYLWGRRRFVCVGSVTAIWLRVSCDYPDMTASRGAVRRWRVPWRLSTGMGKRFSFYRRLPAPLALPLALVLLTLVACGSSSSAPAAAATPVITTDALGNTITIPKTAPQRIVSLTPLDSEILAAVGASSHVVAVDFYTDYPAELASKQKIKDGQSFNLHNEAIVALRPDLVLGYNLFFKADEQKLLTAGISVVDLPNAATVEEGLTELRLVGQLVHTDEQARQVADGLRQREEAVTKKVAAAP